jgi:hypothetical protein
MSILIRRIALAAAMLFPAAALAQGSTSATAEPEVTATVSGRVLDVTTGQGIAGAVIYLPDVRRGALTDATGGFVIERLPAGEHRWRIQRIGYATWEDDAAVAEGDWFNIRLLPRPEVLAGISVVADAFETRRRRFTGSTRVADRAQIMQAAAQNGAEVLESVGGVDVVRCEGGSFARSRTGGSSRNSLSGLTRHMDSTSGLPSDRQVVERENVVNAMTGRPIQAPESADDCLLINGQMVQPQIFLDDDPASISQLTGLAPDELYLVEVYGRGEAVYVYTQRYVERMTRNGDRPRDVVRF